MAKPTRTFTASSGQASSGTAGPDQIEVDLDAIFKMFDPLADGGGIGTDNIKSTEIPTKEYVDQLAENFASGVVPDGSIAYVKLASDLATKFDNLDATLGNYTKIPAYAADLNNVANTYLISTEPAPTSYVDGMAVYLIPAVTNTGPATLNWNSLGTKPIVDTKGNALTSGVLTAGCIVPLRYRASSGNFQLLSEGRAARGSQTFTASGTFTVPIGVQFIDVFLVGGGGYGGKGSIDNSNAGGGGGGGYCRNISGIPVVEGDSWAVTVGAGAVYGVNSAGSSSISKGTSIYSVSGGSNGLSGDHTDWGLGGNGGCGGGQGKNHYSSSPTVPYAGGSDGLGAPIRGGTGQNFTTRAFGLLTETTYSGGGCGGNENKGGLGGGVLGATSLSSTINGGNGTANTGGGGGGGGPDGNGGDGGSGVVIVRWGY